VADSAVAIHGNKFVHCAPWEVAIHVNKLVNGAPWEARRLKAIMDDVGVTTVESWLLAATPSSGRREPADLWIQQLKMTRQHPFTYDDPILSTPRGSVVPEGSFVSPYGRSDSDKVLPLHECRVPASMSASASLSVCDATCAAFDALVCAAMRSSAHPELALFMAQFQREQYVRLVLRPLAEHDESVASGSGGDLSKQETICIDVPPSPTSLEHCEQSWESHESDGLGARRSVRHAVTDAQSGRDEDETGRDCGPGPAREGVTTRFRDQTTIQESQMRFPTAAREGSGECDAGSRSVASSCAGGDDSQLWPAHVVQGLENRQRSFILPSPPTRAGSVQLSLRRGSTGSDSLFSLAVTPVGAARADSEEVYETLTLAAVA
jgi:hypothetical protein